MIDIHSHILPGLDDGAADIGMSVAMARQLAEDGVRVVVATPHVRDDFPTTPAEMHDALARVRSAVEAAGVTLMILPGAEVSLEAIGSLEERNRRAFGLGGRDTLLLLETPYHGWSAALPYVATTLLGRGVTPILAHPERNPAVQERPELLRPLVDAGACVQLTAASLDGTFGRRTQSTATTLLAQRLAHVIASDMHAPGVRSRMSTVEASVGAELARWATHDVPSALLGGEPVPERPAIKRSRSRRLPGWIGGR